MKRNRLLFFSLHFTCLWEVLWFFEVDVSKQTLFKTNHPKLKWNSAVSISSEFESLFLFFFGKKLIEVFFMEQHIYVY